MESFEHSSTIQNKHPPGNNLIIRLQKVQERLATDIGTNFECLIDYVIEACEADSYSKHEKLRSNRESGHILSLCLGLIDAIRSPPVFNTLRKPGSS
jgi:hypothetical protein